MVGKQNLINQEMNLCNDELMFPGAGDNKSNVEGVVRTEWKDIPTELLLQIVSLLGDQMERVPRLEGRHFLRCNKNMNSLVQSLAPKFTKLQILILRQGKPQLEDNSVETIARFCHDLQVLDLSKSFKLSDNSLYALAHGCLNVTKLNISGCLSFSDNALAYLTRFCRKLKVLNCCGCVKAASEHCRPLDIIATNYSP